jgi:triosephosphate isomerase
MRSRLMAGNWKMNGTRATIEPLLRTLEAGCNARIGAEVVVCPPFVYLPLAAECLGGSPIALGAQDLSSEEAGAFTGEVSGLMLRDCNCKFVIVGHSERRARLGEGDALIARKFSRAVGLGLIPILCVGETLSERQEGTSEAVVERQLAAVVEHAGGEAFRSAVIAYEPVWAIGTGRSAAPHDAQEVHAFIRARIAREDSEASSALRILYGGSVTAANASSLFAMTDIDGALVGGASLDGDEFLAICRAA